MDHGADIGRGEESKATTAKPGEERKLKIDLEDGYRRKRRNWCSLLDIIYLKRKTMRAPATTRRDVMNIDCI